MIFSKYQRYMQTSNRLKFYMQLQVFEDLSRPFKLRRALFENVFTEINQTQPKCHSQCTVIILLSESSKELFLSAIPPNNRSFQLSCCQGRAPMLKNPTAYEISIYLSLHATLICFEKIMFKCISSRLKISSQAVGNLIEPP